ncbi:MAG: flagellar filament capping protein FliD, partial [Solirubrobacterales bacterium]
SPGSLTFDVKATAKAHTLAWSQVIVPGQQVAAANSTIELRRQDGSLLASVATGDGSLEAVVRNINSADAGIRATAVQVSAGQLQLHMAATATGESSQFTVSGLTLTGETTLTADSDAKPWLSGKPEFEVASSSNTFSSVLPGLTFTVSKETDPAVDDDNVTLTVERDGGAVADKVQGFVDAANAVLGEIKKNSSYDATTKKGGVLLSDGLARQLQTQVLDAVTAVTTDVAPASSVGVALTRDGTLSFDRTKFLDSYGKSPTSVAAALGRSGSWAGSTGSGDVRLLSASDRTVAGSYDVQVTQVATRATGDVTGTLDVDDSVTLTLNGGAALTVTAQAGDTWQAFAERLNLAAAKAGVRVSAAARPSDDGISVTATAYGGDQVLTLSAAGLTAGAVTPGRDVQGTINGQDASGNGQVLSLNKDKDRADGLTLVVSLATPESATVTYRPGVAQRLASLAVSATDRADGLVTKALSSKQSWIDDLNDRISDWDRRLEMRRTMLQRQFGALEVALGKMRDQSNWLAGQIAGLPS